MSELARCQRCGIAYIDGVFHWSYKMTPTTPEQVLARVCLPTKGKGTNQDKPCLAEAIYSDELGLKKKTSAETSEFIRANNSQVEFENMLDHLKLAQEILDERNNNQV